MIEQRVTSTTLHSRVPNTAVGGTNRDPVRRLQAGALERVDDVELNEQFGRTVKSLGYVQV